MILTQGEFGRSCWRGTMMQRAAWGMALLEYSTIQLQGLMPKMKQQKNMFLFFGQLQYIMKNKFVSSMRTDSWEDNKANSVYLWHRFPEGGNETSLNHLLLCLCYGTAHTDTHV